MIEPGPFLVVHPNQVPDIKSDKSFEPPEKYSAYLPILHGEIGRVQCIPFGYVRIILSQLVPT